MSDSFSPLYSSYVSTPKFVSSILLSRVLCAACVLLELWVLLVELDDDVDRVVSYSWCVDRRMRSTVNWGNTLDAEGHLIISLSQHIVRAVVISGNNRKPAYNTDLHYTCFRFTIARYAVLHYNRNFRTPLICQEKLSAATPEKTL